VNIVVVDANCYWLDRMWINSKDGMKSGFTVVLVDMKLFLR